MVSVDGSIILQILNFLLLVWLLDIVLYKPIRGILNQRKNKISGLISNVKESKKEVLDKDKKYIEGIKKARVLGQKEKEVLVESAIIEEEKIIRKINNDAQVELEKAKSKILAEVDEVRCSLEAEVNIFAKAIGQKILGRSL